MKNILVISPTGSFDNGAEISIFNFQKHLISLGYRVINICPQNGNKGYLEAYQQAGIKIYSLSALKWWWEEAPGDLVGDSELRAYYYRKNIAQIREIICAEKIDFVFTNTVNMFQGAVAAACEEITHFWIIHEFPSGEFAYYRKKLDFIDEFSDEIFSVAGVLNEELTQLFPYREIKSFVPYTEVHFNHPSKSESLRIVSVGRLTKRKNQMELLRAYQILGRKDIELVFIGEAGDDYGQKCREFAKKESLVNVKFLGNVENPWERLTDKDIFVSTSNMETFGLVYVEALLNGLPSIVSDNPGYLSVKQTFGEGQIYPRGDVEKLVELIEKSILDFDKLKEESMSNLEELKKKYSSEAAYQEIINSLEKTSSYPSKTIRHLANIVSLNENQTKPSLIHKIKRRLKRMMRWK